MTNANAMAAATSANANRSAIWAATAMLIGIVAVYAGYGAYFIQVLAILPHERAYLAIARGETLGPTPAYAALLAIWQALTADSLVAARMPSLVFGLIGLGLTFRIAMRLMSDAPSAAALTLPFVLFPSLVGVYSTVGPHALSMALLLAALDNAQRANDEISPPRSARLAMQAGIWVAVPIVLSPINFAFVPFWLIVCALILERGRVWQIMLATAIVVLGLIGSFGLIAPTPFESNLSVIESRPFASTVALPFAMVLVASVMSAAALRSPAVWNAVGAGGAVLAIFGPLLAGAVLRGMVAIGWLGHGQALAAVGYAFPLAIFAAWPLIVWIRHVMPTIKSIIAWIAFPVIMYGCFWIVLGPVDLDRFPYSHRTTVDKSADD
jgi:hypothetical protein